MWKDIVEFEGRYEISDSGEVRNKISQRILALKVDRDGYQQIGLRKVGNRKKYWFSVHRLVACHFLEEPQTNCNQIDHIDRNKTNNDVSNLRWVSIEDNNSNRKLTAWNSNKTTGELYITAYKTGFMIRINRHNYKKRIWVKDLVSAIKQRDIYLNEIKLSSSVYG